MKRHYVLTGIAKRWVKNMPWIAAGIAMYIGAHLLVSFVGLMLGDESYRSGLVFRLWMLFYDVVEMVSGWL